MIEKNYYIILKIINLKKKYMKKTVTFHLKSEEY